MRDWKCQSQRNASYGPFSCLSASTMHWQSDHRLLYINEPCEACPTGLECITTMGNTFCLDCERGFCRPDTMTSCCAFNGVNNCNARMMNETQCQYMDEYWPSYMTENGQVCGGVEISDTATEEGCGCKPNSDTLCTYEADTDPCFVCTFFDMKLPNGDCAGTCRTCAIDCLHLFRHENWWKVWRQLSHVCF